MAEIDEDRRLWFRRQVLPLEPQLRRHAQRFCASIEYEPDDLLQDAFAQLITCNSWRGIDCVLAFAITTMRNRAVRIASRSKIVSIQAVSDLEALNVVHDAPSADRVLAARDELDRLTRIIASLPPQCGKVFSMRKLEGLSHLEIAGSLGISVSTVEKHIIKGLRLCSEALAKDATPAAPRGQNGSELETLDGADQGRSGRVGGPAVGEPQRTGTRTV